MFDVFGLGNAIVDIEVSVDDQYLKSHDIAKGHMTLVDSQRMHHLIDSLDGAKMARCSGGSAANTIFAIQSFGLATAYSCKVANDASGQYFVNEMQQAGVVLNDNVNVGAGASGQCLVMITPDAERTMNTDLGVSSELHANDVDHHHVANARYYYVEGYLSSSPSSTAAAIACRQNAEQAGVKVAVSLSDPSMVEIFSEPMQTILGNGVDVLFCNEEEALGWASSDRLDVAINELKDIAREVYITLGAAGSMAVSSHHRQTAEGVAAHAVDTTGAGDIYAGACLTALCNGAEPVDAARFANYSAAHLVSQYGARLKSPREYAELQKHYTA